MTQITKVLLVFPAGIPFMCFLLLLPLSIPWSEVDDQWLCIIHYIACLSPTVGSVLYHIFMNHEGGVRVYDALLCFDMFGVCLVNTLGQDIFFIALKAISEPGRV